MPFGEEFQFKSRDACDAAIAPIFPGKELIVKTLEEELAFDCNARVDATISWGNLWKSVIPLAVKPLIFCADRRGNGFVTMRFDSPRASACWGFNCILPKRITAGEAYFASPKGSHARSWLQRGSSPLLEREAEGTYRLGMATDNMIEVFIQSAAGPYRGRFLFKEASSGIWSMEKCVSDISAAVSDGFVEHMRALRKGGATYAVIPKDPFNVGAGYRMVDVNRAAVSLTDVRWIAKSEDQRYTLGVAYPCDAIDAHGDYATAEELEKAAFRFYATAKIGLMHADGTTGAGKVVESYIYRGPEWKAEGQVVKAGDWMVGVLWQPEAWNMIKSGRIRGYSMQGTARR